MSAGYTGRIPKKGDRVGARGHQGVFEVVAVNDKARTADLKLENAKGPAVKSVPWTTLVFDDKK